ncbi:MAG: rRNA pseudouridine synthase [Clostridia bacterium]|nr:rRNA pseudouridine synthase [Clostridia bacterium]
MRLDKYLSNMSVGTRSEVKKIIFQGRVQVNGQVVKKIDEKINPDTDLILLDHQEVSYEKYIYLLLNKPSGYITATEDNMHKTVLDLISEHKNRKLSPVGRLDKDTEGLLIITDDGEFNHQLMSPKKHVSKTYFAKVRGKVLPLHQEIFKIGVVLEDDYKCLPAELEILSSSDLSEIKVTITEGKYHQVKRMFKSIGCEVEYLERIAIGNLSLDQTLKRGEYRPLKENEIKLLLEK